MAGVGGAAVALADDVQVDADLLVSGNQASIERTTTPGGTVVFDADLYIACRNGNHIDPSPQLTYDNSSTVPAGGSLSATSATITRRAGWPTSSGNNCGAVAPSGPAKSTVTVTAPNQVGTYTYVVVYGSADNAVKSTTAASWVTVVLKVEDPEPSDSTPPVIKSDVTGTPGANGWYVGPVTVSWDVTDAESGDTIVKEGCDVQSFVDNTAAATATCSASSAGGSDGESVTIKIDQNAPDVSGAPTTSANSEGWYNAPVSIDWTCLEVGPSGLASTCPGNSTIDGEGSDLTVDSSEVKDNAGNGTVATSAPSVNIDKTAPGLTGTVSAFAYDSGTAKWWKDSATVSWVASDPALDNGDAPSGVATQPTDTSVSTDGLGRTSSQSAMDRAGNTGTGNVGDINIDGQAPTVTAVVTSTPAYLDWFKDSVDIQVAASDPTPGSGLATDPSGTVTRSASGTFDATATDNVGHSTKSNTVSFKVDGTGPVVTLDCSDIPTTVYKNDVVSIYWSAEDGQSGLAGAHSGSVTLETATVGAKSAQVASGATSDNVGHTSAASSACGYSVVYKFAGFFQPIDNNGVFNKAKAGSAIPVKFTLGGDQGLDIFATGSPSSQQVNCTTGAIEDLIESTETAGSSVLKYDSASGQYNYVWKTQTAWAGTCRKLTVKLIDGTSQTALFKLTK